ncbi:hypothetical protein [Streptomyces sp. NPDC058545]
MKWSHGTWAARPSSIAFSCPASACSRKYFHNFARSTATLPTR